MFQIEKFAKRFHLLHQLEIVDRFDTTQSDLEHETVTLDKPIEKNTFDAHFKSCNEGLSLMSADCSLGQRKNHLEHTHHNHDTGEPNGKRQKIGRKSYTEMMKYFQPLASLVAKH